jgi:G3E family GTPase
MSSFQAVPFQWHDDANGSQFGDGISHAMPGKRTRIYRIKVYMAASRPMTLTFDAENKAAAIKYAQNRWPQATIKFHETVQRTPA